MITEHGGAFIDLNQNAALHLAAELGLELEDYNGGELPGLPEIYWFNGDVLHVRRGEFGLGILWLQGFSRCAPGIEYAVGSCATRQPVRAGVAGSDADRQLVAVRQADARQHRLRERRRPGEQSALDLIGLTGVNPRSSLDPLPGYDEKWHIVGGNDQLVHGMARQLPEGTVHPGHRLVAIRENSDGSHTLTFDVGGRSRDVVADYVALALPFTLLRDVDLSRAGFTATKRRVIDTLGMGSNAKIHVEVAEKTWARHGFNGVAYTDHDSFDVCWDDSVPLGPGGAPALLLAFPGATAGRSTLTGEAHGPAPAGDVDWFLDRVDRIFAGTRAAYTGAAYEDHWVRDPWVKGAYSFYKVGQYATFGSIAAAAQGRVHFAGEHTSINNQGFLDGAVETGARAAKEIVAQL